MFTANCNKAYETVNIRNITPAAYCQTPYRRQTDSIGTEDVQQ
jgi:hypothetical protein